MNESSRPTELLLRLERGRRGTLGAQIEDDYDADYRYDRAAGVRHRGDPRPGTLPDDQVALGGELGVGVDHDPTRHPELAREVARRGDRAALVQRARADRPAQPVLDLGAERAAPAASA